MVEVEFRITVDNLIERMLSTADAEPQTGGMTDSSKTVSWRAHREAEHLVDDRLIGPLIEKIESEADKTVRDAAYFVLGKIGKNLREGSIAQFLIDRAQTERDRYVISAIYDQLANIPKPIDADISTIVKATKDSDWLIRHSAILALKNSSTPRAEEILISISGESLDPFDIVYANSVLNELGTERAIPTLKKHLKSRKRDVKDSARFAIEEIRGRTVRES